MGKTKPRVLPLVPLARGSVLLPGVTLRIPVQNRSDIAALLAHIYSRASTPVPDANTVTVGCVPLNSPFLGRDGQKLIGEDNGDRRAVGGAGRKQGAYATDPVLAAQDDLFSYGVLAKVSGVQGRGQGQLSLIVEGVSRFKIEKVLQERPYFEARVVVLEEE
ncbi:hypothetical protein LTR28_002438, partial [Elasticomyces elasticus]